ncbi:MAG: MOSC domain-containing protein [Paracoccaceae bacterium]
MRLNTIGIYPVKSLQGGLHDTGEVARIGLAGDRRYMVIRPGGLFVTLREMPALSGVHAQAVGDGLRLAHGDARCDIAAPPPGAPELQVMIFGKPCRARDAGDAAAQFLGDAIGTPLRLVHLFADDLRQIDPDFAAPGEFVSFADGFPLLLTTQASLIALNEALPDGFGPLAMGRFRPNLVVEGAAPWAEDHWRRIRIGAMTFRIVKPCARCVIVTQDETTGIAPPPGHEPLATLRRIHRSAQGRPCFGQYLIPEAPGRLHIGDPVQVLDTGASNLHDDARALTAG